MPTARSFKESSQRAVALMQNLPSPSGAKEDTRPVDYEKERFFFSYPGNEITPSNRQNIPDVFNKLYEHLNLIEVGTYNVGSVYLSGTAMSTTITLAAPSSIKPLYQQPLVGIEIYPAITLSLTSWLVSSVHLQYQPVFYTAFSHEIPMQILSFCQEKDILRYLPVALSLIEENFPSVKQVSFEVEQDPEAGEEWLAIRIQLLGQTSEILDLYDKYTDSWVSGAPWPERSLIRLSYDII